MTITDTETPRAWVGCLGCYNAGALVGEWVDGAEAGEVEIRTLHESAQRQGIKLEDYAGDHDELWVMDFEGYGGFLTGECSPSEAQRIAEAIDEIPEYIPREAVAAYLDNLGQSITDFDETDFSDTYCGEWSSGADYAEDFADSTGAIPSDAAWPQTYIDWDRAYDELGCWEAKASGGGVHIFRQ